MSSISTAAIWCVNMLHPSRGFDLLTLKLDHSIGAGHRCLSLLSKAFNLAIRWGWRTTNPATGVPRHPERARTRYLTTDEYKRLAAALGALEADHPGGVAALRLLLLTGARLGEIVGARREWVDGNVLRLPDSKTGAKEIYLAPAAIEIIQTAPDTGGWLVGINSRPAGVWDRVLKLSGIKDLRIHDLRHSFASQALADGLTLAQIGELLGHKTAQTTKRYAHLVDDLRRSAATMVANSVAKKMRR